METKKCYICGKDKDIKEFFIRKSGTIQSGCKSCRNANYNSEGRSIRRIVKRTGMSIEEAKEYLISCQKQRDEYNKLLEQNLKKCNHCNEIKDLSQFAMHKKKWEKIK